MPIYEYACGSCEHRFETIQKASETPLRDCPECGDSALKKLLSAPVFRLKGSGWYETDFKSKDRRNVAGDGADRGKDGKSAETGNGEKSESSKNGKAESANTGESKAKDSGAKSASGGDGGSKMTASKSD